MKIARIVSSVSHIDYIARVIDELDAIEAPKAENYGFGQFVAVDRGGIDAVGIVYNSVLANPEYANFGPRLSPKPALELFSPDFLSEQGVLLGVLMIGTVQTGHGIPRSVIPPGAVVESLSADAVHRFHADGSGGVRLHYYPQVLDHAGIYAIPLLENIIDQLSAVAGEESRKRLDVLKNSLSWQRTMGAQRF